jgi:hypothetical protein
MHVGETADPNRPFETRQKGEVKEEGKNKEKKMLQTALVQVESATFITKT